MCISGGMSILMSVPLGSERREVTVEILYPQIFAGINALKPQGQIKHKSELSSEEWKTVVFSSRYHENRTHGLLTHFQPWGSQRSSCHRLQGTFDHTWEKWRI